MNKKKLSNITEFEIIDFTRKFYREINIESPSFNRNKQYIEEEIRQIEEEKLTEGLITYLLHNGYQIGDLTLIDKNAEGDVDNTESEIVGEIKEKNETIKIYQRALKLTVVGFMMLTLSLILISRMSSKAVLDFGYKNGQIDAIQGKYKYNCETYNDGKDTVCYELQK